MLGVIRDLMARLRDHTRYTGPFDDWEAASAFSSGYDDGHIVERVAHAQREVVAGRACYERDSILFYQHDDNERLLAALQQTAKDKAHGVTVLDYGGSLGSSYWQHRYRLEQSFPVNWCVVEQPLFVEAGRREFTTDQLNFYENISELPVEPDFILLSSVLQYLPDALALLQELLELGSGTVLIDRTPFSRDDRRYITVQHVPRSIYRASYVSWLFSLEEVRALFSPEYLLVEEFAAQDGSLRSGEFTIDYGGLLARKR